MVSKYKKNNLFEIRQNKGLVNNFPRNQLNVN